MDQHKGSNISKLYKSFESQLEGFAEKLLTTKVSDQDNVLGDVQATIERIFIRAAMKLSNSNVSKAAKLLGMSRNTLIRKLKGPA
jgi:transcriptional regulator with PAS, ATPase and Fis domain